MAHHFVNIHNSYPPFKKGGRTAFFCHSSFEPRSLACIQSLTRCPGIDSAFIFYSNDFLSSKTYKHNHAQIVDHFGSVSINSPIEVPLDCDNDNYLLDLHRESISHAINQADDIAVDLSAFPRGAMICLVDLIIKEKGGKPLYLFYSEPEKYATEKNGKKATWLTKGTKNIITLPGFSGEKQDNKKSLMVLLLGHNSERSISTVEATDPDMMVVISQGTLKQRKGLQEVFLKNNANIIDKYAYKIADILTVPTRGWEAVYDAFNRIHGLYKNNYNITASLDGTKMQVFGALAYCQRHPEIELLYTEPEQYNCDEYTRGIGLTWWLEVPDIKLFKKG
jgi:hypothetical protein